MADITNLPSIEMVRRGSLRKNPKNARKHSPKQLEQLVQSLRRFGFKGALIVDETDMILAGNALWEASGKCGYEEVPVIRASFLSDDDKRAFVLAHNRLAELSGWDDELLQEELNDLFNGGYDLDITGFSTSDLDFSIPQSVKDEGNEQIELPDPDAASVSRIGDLWFIGSHRLYNGNSRYAASLETLLGGELAAMVFGDAPYNVRIANNVSGLGKNKHREFPEASGEMSASEFTAFLRVMFRNCARFSKAGSIHYQCMDWRHIREILDAADGVYTEFKQLLVWNKVGSAGMGTFYRSQHELIFAFKSGRGRHINNFGLKKFRSNVWDYIGAATFRKGREADLAAHSTVKSTAMVADAILDCSNRGDLILDPFSGSATTLIAAHRTGRRGAAIELDSLYVDTGLRRLSAVSGLVPTLSDGRTFNQVAADRALEREIGND